MNRPISILAAVLLALCCSGVVRSQELKPDQPKAAIPDIAAQKQALEQVDSLYREEIARAKQREDKIAIAKKMLEAALETSNDPAGRYILLTKAVAVSAQAGDVETTMAAVETLTDSYGVDRVKTMVDALTSVAKTLTPSKDAQSYADHANSTIDQAIAADRYDLARELANSVLTVTKRSGDIALEHQASDGIKEIAEVEAAYAKTKAAESTLKQKPSDPEANLIVGRFRCFIKGDWVNGLPRIALGSDNALKGFALKELAIESNPEMQLALADNWWNAAEKEVGLTRRQIRLHAEKWYRVAAPSLAGLSKAKAEKRVSEIASEPVSGRTAGGGVMNLLNLYDPVKDIIKGKWRFADKTLSSLRPGWNVVEFPISAKRSYDLKVKFIHRGATESVNLFLPAGAAETTLVLSGWGRQIAGLSDVNRQEAVNNETTRAGALKNGREYSVDVQVTLDGDDATIAVTLDGEPYIHWHGAQTALTVQRDAAIPPHHNGCLGIGTNDLVTFTFVQVKMTD